MLGYLLYGLCFKPTYSLRRQLLLSFGSSAVLTIIVVVVIAAISAQLARDTVKESSADLLREQVVARLVRNSLYVAESVQSYIWHLEGTVTLLAEFTEERIVGYPNPGWEEDKFVPFVDRETSERMYPLKSKPLQMDWECEKDITMNNIDEIFQERSDWVRATGFAYSSHAYYYMQGICDPDATDPTLPEYYINCTDANNNVTSGGVIHTTKTNKGLYDKSADLVPFLKAIFEAEHDINYASIFFANSGAGSFVQYPGRIWGLTARNGYISLGCEWMRAINPRTGRPFATEEEVARCHPNGEQVNMREFNVLERGWCQEMILKPGVRWVGPIPAADQSIKIFTIGKGVFDRLTGELIGCASITADISAVDEILKKSKISEDSDLSVIRYEDNTVFSDTLKVISAGSSVVDTGFITEKNLKKLRDGIDFTVTWEEGRIFDKLRRNVVFTDDGMYTAFPVPLPPNRYSDDYKPDYLVLHKISNAVFAVSNEMSEGIDAEVARVTSLSVFLGISGIILVFIILWYVSKTLTEPLLWMEKIAWSIVNHNDERSEENLEISDEMEFKTKRKFVPNTEISELVTEFRTMIKGFSGSDDAATVAMPAMYEVANQLTWQSDYQQLYSYTAKLTKRMPRINIVPTDIVTSEGISAEKSDEPNPVLVNFNAGHKSDCLSVDTPSLIVPPPPKKNLGRNLRTSPQENSKKGVHGRVSIDYMHACRSSLFWWILLLIVVPLVLTNAAICTILSLKLGGTVQQWVQRTGDVSFDLELKALKSTAVLKSIQTHMSLDDIIRDLYILTRFAGWLFFGGLSRSDAFVEVDQAAEECKVFDDPSECSFYDDPERAVCACEWEDLFGFPCSSNYTDARLLQKRYFVGQARDADENGARSRATSFFKNEGADISPATTLWWDNLDSLPGFFKGANASGFETTYDRVRVSSAMSVVEIPLYNYATKIRQPKHVLGTALSFEEDGLITGYGGCDHHYTKAAFFVSDKENRAYEINSQLCPEGKYGYDARCREWYAVGRQFYEQEQRPVHLTSPYRFAATDFYAASASSPIVNPSTRRYAGQSILDFSPGKISTIFNRNEEDYAFVITRESGHDTVVSRGKFRDWGSASILDLLFAREGNSTENRKTFETGILKKMKQGERGVGEFFRMGENNENERIKIAYEPVEERVLLPVDPSDFNRGSNASNVFIYSVGIAYSEDKIREPWTNVEDDILYDLRQVRVVYVSLVASMSLIFVIFACFITLRVSTPILMLNKIVKTINAGEIRDDVPPLRGGTSRETQQVYNSFAKLYKIIRISNVAFFSGNLTWAYRTISDALKLFRKVRDEKAIGVACNNVGNVLHAMYNDARYVGECCSKIPGICIVDAALVHYNESVSIAQCRFDLATEQAEKVRFAEQLADRMFNRALFLLLIANDKCAPQGAHDMALADIAYVRELDYDCKDFWIEKKLLLKNSSEYFFRLLHRILGLLDYYGDDEVRIIWDARDLVTDADNFLFLAWEHPNVPLFYTMNRAVRLQQLEAMAIKLDLCSGRLRQAARLAMRMLVEDEYLLECAFSIAATALLKMVRNEDDSSNSWTNKAKLTIRSDLRKMLRSAKQTNLDLGKCLIFAFEINERWEGSNLLERVNEKCLQLYDDCCCLKEDLMGLVAYTSQGDLNVPLGRMCDNKGRQRCSLDLATTSTSDQVCPSFPMAIQMLMDDTSIVNENDSYILLITDGYSWETSAHANIRTQIKRMNKERETKIHVFILGMDIKEEIVRDQCKEMCTVSKKSFYADIDEQNVDHVLDDVSAQIRGIQIRNVCSPGLIMEKF